jgi:serine/threonine-protein kinase
MCPLCGERTHAEACPKDGQKTVTAPPAPLDRVGGIIAGRYRVVELLGRGGFGDVYKAFHVGTHESVALKVLRPELHAEAKAIDRFTAEARMSASLKHPNTVRVFDFGTTPEGDLYLAMEFLDGVSLDELLEDQGKLPPLRAVHLMAQVLKSLSEAHRRQIIHRDLKPENIFVVELAGEKDFIRVIDFGIAKFLRENMNLTQVGSILGTPYCMSPEQIRSETLDGRSDLYAVGVVLHRCLTGHYPYDSENAFAALAGHLNEPVPKAEAPGVDAELQGIVMKALQKDRKQRFADVDAMRAALDDWTERTRRDQKAAAEADELKTQALDILVPLPDANGDAATQAMDVLTPERLAQALAASTGRQRKSSPLVEGPSAPTAVAAPSAAVGVTDTTVSAPLPSSPSGPSPSIAITLMPGMVPPPVAPAGGSGPRHDPDATRVGLEALPDPIGRKLGRALPRVSSENATVALDIIRPLDPSAETVYSEVLPQQSTTVHKARVVSKVVPRRSSVLMWGVGLAVLMAAGVATGVVLANLSDQRVAPPTVVPAVSPAAPMAVAPSPALQATRPTGDDDAPPPEDPAVAQALVTAGSVPVPLPLARTPTTASVPKSAREAVPAPVAPVVPDPCSGTEGDKAWCISCPAAQQLSARSKWFCGCKEARGETDSLAWFCECRFPKEQHAVGSPAWCKCNGGDPACQQD